MIHLLTIDYTAIIISAIGAIVSLGTVAMTLIINKNVKGYKKEVDGMKTELVEAVKGQYQAEGELKGKADQKVIEKANQDEKNIAVDIALHTTAPEKAIDVNIVDQDKPVEVTNKKK